VRAVAPGAGAGAKPPNGCFGCGQGNAAGMHLEFSFDEEQRKVIGKFSLGERYQGASGIAFTQRKLPDHLPLFLIERKLQVHPRGVPLPTSETTVRRLGPRPGARRHRSYFVLHPFPRFRASAYRGYTRATRASTRLHPPRCRLRISSRSTPPRISIPRLIFRTSIPAKPSRNTLGRGICT